MPELFVGIDCSGKGLFFLTFAMDAEGFMQLWKTITQHSKDLSEVLVAVESTACYHINLYSFLTAKGVPTVVINPLLIANLAKLSLRKTRTDKKDTMTIAQTISPAKEVILQGKVRTLQHLRERNEAFISHDLNLQYNM
jgi:transposase